MKKIITIIGARPQIIKSAAISRAISTHFQNDLIEIVVHTGQHYDENMSDVFFTELGIPQPAYNLGVGSGSHAKQTTEMMLGIEEVLLKETPHALLVYGDTNSTLAGAVTASKLGIPVVHVEAGLRSFNKAMPEEINRVVCDHLSTLLFSPTKLGLDNLIKEGFNPSPNTPFTSDNPKCYHCGDVMYDNSIFFATVAEKENTVISTYNLTTTPFILCTIHRNNNTDDPSRLSAIFNALNQLTERYTDTKIVLPLHPRTKKCLKENLPPDLFEEVQSNKQLLIIEPQSFLNIIALEKKCKLVVTDSGGLQKEAYFFEKPCVILRSETEWMEIVEQGNARIVDADTIRILDAVEYFHETTTLSYPKLYGNGDAAEFICHEIVRQL